MYAVGGAGVTDSALHSARKAELKKYFYLYKFMCHLSYFSNVKYGPWLKKVGKHWSKIVKNIHSSICARHSLIQYKTVYWLHMSMV